MRVGNLALISQSGAVCTALFDWAGNHGIGFSSVASPGGALDVWDFGEVFDFCSGQRKPTASLMYVEGVRRCAVSFCLDARRRA